MPCPLCGDICRCLSGAKSSALNDSNHSAPESSSAWRQEVASRLNRYHARRPPRPPRYPSLRLRFEEPVVAGESSGASLEPPDSAASLPLLSSHALALDRFSENAACAVEIPEAPSFASSGIQAQKMRATSSQVSEPVQHKSADAATAAVPTAAPSAKIIEFPRSWTPEPAPFDELAEPVVERPRILEAPAIVPPPPALGGITIEPAQKPQAEKRPGIDIPLQSAPLERRIFSAVIDGFIIVAACALFGFIFCEVAAINLPRLQAVGLDSGLFAMFWAAYQYLFLVYSGSTPGLRLARLDLARFDGGSANRRLRRWRVFASFLSAISLGMGYVWVFLDEDSLCWHDRITHTYLAPRG
jgi:uncharacterized RDD family membrane protein YckC